MQEYSNNNKANQGNKATPQILGVTIYMYTRIYNKTTKPTAIVIEKLTFCHETRNGIGIYSDN